jgi:hypothetical protein
MTRLRRCSVRWYRHLSTKLQRPVLLTPLGSTTQQDRVHTTIQAVSKDAALFKIHALRLTLFRSRFFETPTLLRCSIPSLPPETGHDAIRDPKVATFADYVATYRWEQDLLADATEVECPDSSLYELLQQRNVNILAASDGGQRMTTAPSVG